MTSSESASQRTAQQSTAHHKYGIVVVGIDRPEMVDALLREHPTSATGFSVPVYVLESDEKCAQEILSSQQLSWPSRVRLFTGSQCVKLFLDALRTQLDCWLPRHLLVTGQRVVGIAQQAAAGLEELVQEQARQTDAVRLAISQRWSDRGIEYWNSRFADIERGAQARVLVSTTRFSSFIQHSAQDLVGSFNSLGHEARMLIEPNSQTNVTPLLCLQAIKDFDPDLVVVINFPRSMHKELFPDGCPHVCWIQDAMGHLFQSNLQHAPTPFDFIAGHVFNGAAAFEGVASENKLSFPVPISDSKFHSGPISPEDSDRYACDIAYVSHQSETPERFHEKFVCEFPESQRPAIQSCRDSIGDIVGRWGDGAQISALAELRDRLTQDIGRGSDQSVRNLLWNQYITPLVERILRHETLEWASQIADKHDLTFKIFGKGWENHPTLRKHACGELMHGDDLRSCYQSAAVHLHASMKGCGHQRVFECAFSGGLALCRRSWDELHLQNSVQMTEFMNRQLPADASFVRWKWPAYVIENHPDLQRLLNDRAWIKPPLGGWDHNILEQRLAGTIACDVDAKGNKQLRVYAQIGNDSDFCYYNAPLSPPQMRPLEILGDSFGLTFSSCEELESRILRAINDSLWRSESSQGIVDRARKRISMDCFANDLLDLVGARFVLAQDTVGAGATA